jgi:hypothetical protein
MEIDFSRLICRRLRLPVPPDRRTRGGNPTSYLYSEWGANPISSPPSAGPGRDKSKRACCFTWKPFWRLFPAALERFKKIAFDTVFNKPSSTNRD